MEARYLCTDTRGRRAFSLTYRYGLFWRKEKKKLAYWNGGWEWESGSAVTDPDTRIALCEAADKVGV